MLDTQDLSFNYTAAASFRFPDLHCDKGEVLVITGASGKGKTTLLHLLAGLLRPAGGRISIGDTTFSALSAKETDRFRGNNIGIIFQQPHFLAALTVLQNLAMAQWLSTGRTNSMHALELLKQLDIYEHANKKLPTLSVGQQQRVSVARALINKPQLVLADEPTSSLDDFHCLQVAHLLQEQVLQTQSALVIVTHDQRLKQIFKHNIQLK